VIWTLVGILLFALLVLNVRASIAVLRDGTVTVSQRAVQLAFVWFTPVIGASLALYLRRKHPERGSEEYVEPPSSSPIGS
jgi:hypothetical protein